MKHICTYIVIVLLAALGVWLFLARMIHTTTDRFNPPILKSISKDGFDLSIKDLKGQYVLVNFWDSRNAVSRIAAGEYDRYYKTHPQSGLKLLSVNTDMNPKLFNEIIRTDGLDSLTQFHIRDIKARGLTPGYHPEGGYSSYLLNPSGKIIAVNPSVQSVQRIVSNGN